MYRYHTPNHCHPVLPAFGLLLLLFFFTQTRAQQRTPHFTSQLSVTTENDRYMFKGKDGYYTNGLMLRYTRALAPKLNSQKRLHHFELGQKIFMPHSRRIYLPGEIDRPVTGYLFLKYSRTIFQTANTLWQWGVSADAIGNASGARQVQNTFHNWINVNSNWWGWVWDYQLKSQPGLNVHGQFAKALFAGKNASRFQVVPVTRATLGTSFSNISQGVMLQFGKLRAQSQSAFWEAAPEHASSTGRGAEWAIYYHPELLYQVYNATIQGGLFRKDKGPITSAPKPWVLTHQAGILFSGGRYQVRLAANFQSKEARSQRFSQSFGSVQVACRFR